MNVAAALYILQHSVFFKTQNPTNKIDRVRVRVLLGRFRWYLLFFVILNPVRSLFTQQR